MGEVVGRVDLGGETGWRVVGVAGLLGGVDEEEDGFERHGDRWGGLGGCERVCLCVLVLVSVAGESSCVM